MRRGIKRLFDVVVSLLGLVLLAPLMLVLAAAVRWTLGSPVIFCQRRSGLHGRPFFMLKLRTMTQARDSHGSLLPDEERLTRLGGILRRTSLDELPQLWNVLRGEMSLIGPRPLPVDYWNLYNPEQRRRHDVPPGVVGWAGVKGRNANTWEKKFELDLYYVDHWSLLFDAKIFIMAIGTALTGSGVSQEGQATCGVFTGTIARSGGSGVCDENENEKNATKPGNLSSKCSIS